MKKSSNHEQCFDVTICEIYGEQTLLL